MHGLTSLQAVRGGFNKAKPASHHFILKPVFLKQGHTAHLPREQWQDLETFLSLLEGGGTASISWVEAIYATGHRAAPIPLLIIQPTTYQYWQV